MARLGRWRRHLSRELTDSVEKRSHVQAKAAFRLRCRSGRAEPSASDVMHLDGPAHPDKYGQPFVPVFRKAASEAMSVSKRLRMSSEMGRVRPRMVRPLDGAFQARAGLRTSPGSSSPAS